MTSTVSFKDKLKQIFSVVLWDLKGCKSSMLVYSILSAVATVIIFTLVMVLTGEKATFATIAINDSDVSAVPISQRIQVFQAAASAIIGLLTLIFTIIYTVQIFSYMHNKRKVDFYGSLPISRARLFLAKCGAAYLFSIVPMLVFMGIIAIASICTGTLLLPQVTQMYVNFIVGTLACISAYGFLSACCGTTFNTVIMFIAVCVCYPLSMIFVRGYIDAFFTGAYTGDISKSIIMNALNPISAYFGNNLIYWVIFSIACIAFGTLLIMKRRSERAQTSFAYYIPCHIIKVIVSFLAGMFLGTMFGSLNVFGNGVAGFVFGFILASAPAFLITHMLFYKGMKKLVRTLPIYGGLAVVVIAGVALINLDIFGYNSYVPKTEDVKSAGIILTEYYYSGNDNFSSVMSKSAGDFTEKSDIENIIKIHNKVLDGRNDKIKSAVKFRCVWGSMLYNAVGEFIYDDAYAIAYKLNSGRTVTRYYSEAMLSMADSMDDDDNYYGTYYDDTDSIKSIANPLVSSKTYITKYSGLMNAESDAEIGTVQADITAMVRGKSYTGLSVVSSNNSYLYGSDSDSNNSASKKIILNELNEALKKDFEADDKYLNGVLCDPYGIIHENEYYYSSYDYLYSGYSLPDIREMYSKDFVCEISMDYRRQESDGVFSYFNTLEETYFIPKSYTNTIEVLQKYGILNSDSTINLNSEFYSDDSYYEDYDGYYDDYYAE